jgi:hypothetical protein
MLKEVAEGVLAGFSTHPGWDHVLWHAGPRRGRHAF